MRNTNRTYQLFFILVAAFLLHSCAVFPPTAKPAPAGIASEAMSNGHLLRISAGKAIDGQVSASLYQGRWLMVTIEDTTLETRKFEPFKNDLVESVKIDRFPAATQLTFQLKESFQTANVIHRPPASDILISLFSGK